VSSAYRNVASLENDWDISAKEWSSSCTAFGARANFLTRLQNRRHRLNTVSMVLRMTLLCRNDRVIKFSMNRACASSTTSKFFAHASLSISCFSSESITSTCR